MRILVFPQLLSLGGASIAAVELAGEMRRRGHDVTVFGPPGPLVAAVRDRGVRYVEAPRRGDEVTWPSPPLIRALCSAVRSVSADVVHTFEWGPAMQTLAGPWVLDGVPLVATFMSMVVPRFVPRGVPVTVGTRALRDELVRRGFATVELVVPPVDTTAEPAVSVTGRSPADLPVPPDVPVVAVVSRLHGLKVEGVSRLIRAAGELAAERDLRLVVVGDGAAAPGLRAEGAGVNAAAGREVVVFTGSMPDPGPVYARADVVVGMGSSALRAMAFGKPVIVIGTAGYSEVFRPETSGEFVVQGFWGFGDGNGSCLAEQLRVLLADPGLRLELGRFGYRFVTERHHVRVVGDRLERILARAASQPPSWAARKTVALEAWTRFAVLRGYYRTRRLVGEGGRTGRLGR